MKATRRTSAPWASASSTMVVAAPGEVPHTAVLPGMMPSRLISQPSAAAASRVAPITVLNSSQSPAKERSIGRPITAATMAPITPCAAW